MVCVCWVPRCLQVMELCVGGELMDRIVSQSHFSERVRLLSLVVCAHPLFCAHTLCFPRVWSMQPCCMLDVETDGAVDPSPAASVHAVCGACVCKRHLVNAMLVVLTHPTVGVRFPQVASGFFRQMLQGVQHCHSNLVVHRCVRATVVAVSCSPS